MIKKDVLKIKNKKETMNLINCIPFKSHDLVVNGVSTYTYIIKDFDIMFKEITDKFLAMVGSSYHIIDFWINKYFYKGCVNKHNHPTDKKLTAKTGVFYFKKPKKGGDLIINNKNISMNEGDIIVFNPDQFHWSQPNLSKQEKIIFSVNMVKNLTRKELNKNADN
tara:strand:+ start:74 stop:568 length:495 start_codon:yes stop_codon:yes gene_type:complete